MEQWLLVATAIIVGIHIFPLAPIFNIKTENLVGATFVLLGTGMPIVNRKSGFRLSPWCNYLPGFDKFPTPKRLNL